MLQTIFFFVVVCRKFRGWFATNIALFHFWLQPPCVIINVMIIWYAEWCAAMATNSLIASFVCSLPKPTLVALWRQKNTRQKKQSVSDVDVLYVLTLVTAVCLLWLFWGYNNNFIQLGQILELLFSNIFICLYILFRFLLYWDIISWLTNCYLIDFTCLQLR